MDNKELSEINSVLQSLENGTYIRHSIFTVREVKNKVLEFSKFFNSVGLITLINADSDECRELVPLFLNLKKSIKLSLSEMGFSHTRKIQNYNCPECDELIEVPPDNIWENLQKHEHFEELFTKVLNGTLELSTFNQQSHSSSEIVQLPSSSRSITEHNYYIDIEHTDSGFDYEEGLTESCSPEEEEPLGCNTFRFNFQLEYDPVVENTLYPDSLKSLNAYDNCKYTTIQKLNPFRASCLLCCCDLLSTKRINKKQCLDHVLGQRHMKGAKDESSLGALENYHRLFWNLETCYQAHQVYFEPNSSSSVRCNLCNSNVADEKIIGHIQEKRHTNFVIDMYDKNCVDFYLLDIQVGAYGIEPTKKTVEKQPKREVQEKVVKDKKEKKLNSELSKSDTKVVHNIRRSVNDKDSKELLDLLPHRFKGHLKYLIDKISYVFCNACMRNIKKTTQELKTHIFTGQHQQNVKIVLPKYKYFCEICNKKFHDENSWELHFKNGKFRHTKVSKNRLNNLNEYECTTCNTIIFGDEISLTRHKTKTAGGQREKPKEPKLSQEIKQLFSSHRVIEVTGEKLTSEANKTMTQQTSECCKKLEEVLTTAEEICKAYPFGSRMSGLGDQNSDLDIFIDIGDMYFGRRLQGPADQCLIIKQAANTLSKDKNEFTKIQQVLGARTPIVKIKHVTTGLECDLSFRHGLSVENTKFLKLCLKLQPITQPFILILKKWCHYNKFTDNLSTYALAMLAIFYLQVNGYMLSVKKLKEVNPAKAPIISGWETIKYTMPVELMKNHVTQYEHSIVRLLKDFFMFYAHFNYENVVCPLLGDVIRRNLFADPKLLPPEMITYVKQLKSDQPEIFRFTSPFCIQDPFDLSHNLTKAFQGSMLANFKKICELSYKHIESLN